MRHVLPSLAITVAHSNVALKLLHSFDYAFAFLPALWASQSVAISRCNQTTCHRCTGLLRLPRAAFKRYWSERAGTNAQKKRAEFFTLLFYGRVNFRGKITNSVWSAANPVR